MSDKKIIELFKSGDFTIIYWDNDEPTLYRGKWDKDKEFKKDDYKEMNKHVIDLQEYHSSYLPVIVELLVKALGGKSDSI